MLLSLLKETYHILLSSITIILYVKEIFEKWRQVVNKNQSITIKTAGDSTKNMADQVEPGLRVIGVVVLDRTQNRIIFMTNKVNL